MASGPRPTARAAAHHRTARADPGDEDRDVLGALAGQAHSGPPRPLQGRAALPPRPEDPRAALRLSDPGRRGRAHWEEGGSLLFDDTFDHEAWNDTDGVRVVLFVDVVRPLRFPASALNGAVLKAIGVSPFIPGRQATPQRLGTSLRGAQDGPRGELAPVTARHPQPGARVRARMGSGGARSTVRHTTRLLAVALLSALAWPRPQRRTTRPTARTTPAASVTCCPPARGDRQCPPARCESGQRLGAAAALRRSAGPLHGPGLRLARAHHDQIPNLLQGRHLRGAARDIESTEHPRAGLTIVRDRYGYRTSTARPRRLSCTAPAGRARRTGSSSWTSCAIPAAHSSSSFAGGAAGNRAMDRTQWALAPYTEADLQSQIDHATELYGAGRPAGGQRRQRVRRRHQRLHRHGRQPINVAGKVPGEYAAFGKVPQHFTVTDVIATASLIGGIFGKGGGSEVNSALTLQAFQRRFGDRGGRTAWLDFRSKNDPEAPTTVAKPFPVRDGLAVRHPRPRDPPTLGSVRFTPPAPPVSGIRVAGGGAALGISSQLDARPPWLKSRSGQAPSRSDPSSVLGSRRAVVVRVARGRRGPTHRRCRGREAHRSEVGDREAAGGERRGRLVRNGLAPSSAPRGRSWTGSPATPYVRRGRRSGAGTPASVSAELTSLPPPLPKIPPISEAVAITSVTVKCCGTLPNAAYSPGTLPATLIGLTAMSM